MLFQAAGPVFESLDALFIGRRKNAGQSAGSPLFGEIMFYNQQSVDQFVTQYNSPAVNTEVWFIISNIYFYCSLGIFCSARKDGAFPHK